MIQMMRDLDWFNLFVVFSSGVDISNFDNEDDEDPSWVC